MERVIQRYNSAHTAVVIPALAPVFMITALMFIPFTPRHARIRS